MRRLVTLALALGLTALVAMAAVDALRDSGDSVRETQPGSDDRAFGSFEDRAAEVERLRRLGVSGRLYLSPDACGQPGTAPIRILRLPELELDLGRRWLLCSFTLSDDERLLAGGTAVWSPRDPVFATSSQNGVLLTAGNTGLSLSLPGSAPAFKRDGTFTHVRNGAVLAWTSDCAEAAETLSPPVPLGPEQVGPYCSRTAVSRRELRRGMPEGDRLESVGGLAWLDSSRLLAILRSGEAWWISAYEDGRSLGTGNGLIGRSTTIPLADPSGRYVALTPSGYLEVYDRDRYRVWASSSVPASAFAWSPDGDWLAYAADDRNVYFLRTSDWTTRFSLTADTVGLAWR